MRIRYKIAGASRGNSSAVLLSSMLLAIGLPILILLCTGMAYRMGFREGREQGLTEAYRLYGGHPPAKAKSGKGASEEIAV